MHVSIMEGSPVYEDIIRFDWVTHQGSFFHVDFLENKIVGFDVNADQWQDSNQNVYVVLY